MRVNSVNGGRKDKGGCKRKKKKKKRERDKTNWGGGGNLAPTLKLSKLLSDSINSQKKHSFSFSSLLLKKNHEKRRISISKKKKEKILGAD